MLGLDAAGFDEAAGFADDGVSAAGTIPVPGFDATDVLGYGTGTMITVITAVSIGGDIAGASTSTSICRGSWV